MAFWLVAAPSKSPSKGFCSKQPRNFSVPLRDVHVQNQHAPKTKYWPNTAWTSHCTCIQPTADTDCILILLTVPSIESRSANIHGSLCFEPTYEELLPTWLPVV